MVELLLFLGTICLFFFLPADFRILYRKIGAEDTLILEMSFLRGMLKRRKTLSPLGGGQGNPKRETTFGRWFFYRKRQIKPAGKQKPEAEPESKSQAGDEAKPSYRQSLEDLQEFMERYRNYGFGITLLTYFLPAQYHHWILVTPELEKKGSFVKFSWSTHFGTGSPVSTALGYGALWALKSGIDGYLRRKIRFKTAPRLVVTPDFLAAKWDTVFDCIFRIKLGHIIIAALIARFRLRMMKGGVGIE